MRWGEIDVTGRRLRIARAVTTVNGKPVVGAPKSGKVRTVALPAHVAAMLTTGEPGALVFPHTASGWMRASNVWRRWWAQAVANAQGRSGARALTAHELRHTAASLAIQAGASIRACRTCWACERGAHAGPLRAPLWVGRGRCGHRGRCAGVHPG